MSQNQDNQNKNNKNSSSSKVEDKFTLRILEDQIKSVQKSISQTKRDTNTILEKMKRLEAYFLTGGLDSKCM